MNIGKTLIRNLGKTLIIINNNVKNKKNGEGDNYYLYSLHSSLCYN